MPLKISIITITLNSEKYLSQTIDSVVQQSYPHIEYILVDGVSTDNTLNIIKAKQQHIHRWISEPDDGIGDAMNKGIALATGDYLLFLHSDDYLFSPESIAQAVAHIEQQQHLMVYASAIRYQRKQSVTIYQPRAWNFMIYFKTRLWHQGVLCHRRVFKQIGGFDAQFKIAMDYDFFLRVYLHGLSVALYPDTLAVMRDTGVSSRQDWQNLSRRFDEERAVHKKNQANPLMGLVYAFYWLLYKPYRRLRYLLSLRNMKATTDAHG